MLALVLLHLSLTMAASGNTAGRKTTIEIPIPSIRRYVPGSGPPPPRITLTPPRDSTAYIIGQFVLPTEKDTTATSRRLIHYHIGFTDLPAAKILVPCNKVLDYVSPRELEDWEYQNAERKEEERVRERAERQRARAAAKKKAVQADEAAPMPVLGLAEEALLLAGRVTGPSLSTPQKRKLVQTLEEDDTGETSNLESDDAAIERQLQEDGELGSGEIDDDLDEDSESVDQLASRYGTSGAATPSQVGSVVPPAKEAVPATAALETAVLGSDASASNPDSSAVSTPGRVHPPWARMVGLHGQSERPINAKHNGHVQPDGSGYQTTPKPKLAKSQHQQRPFNSFVAVSAARSMTSGTGTRLKETTNGTLIAAKAAVVPHLPVSGENGQATKVPPNAFSGENQPKKRNKKRKRESKQEEAPAGDEWEVKELLDDAWVLENGVKVHKYLVLWEGDWPEDQNPTWEPAENIQDENLIKRYQKKKVSLPKHPRKVQKTLHQDLSVRYASVAEAFEGGIDELAGPVDNGRDSHAEGPNEELLVTENAGDFTPNGAPVTKLPAI